MAEVKQRLAGLVAQQWTREATLRSLNDPIPVRWERIGQAGTMDHPANIEDDAADGGWSVSSDDIAGLGLFAGRRLGLSSASFGRQRCRHRLDQRMGEWSTISYLRTADLDHIDDVVARLCAAEEYSPVPEPPRPEVPSESWMAWHETPDAKPLWTFVLVPGAGEWTVVVTLPFVLLGARRPGASRMRLADLAVLAGCDAFTFELFDGTAWVLAEANAHGETALSGFPYEDEWFYHDEPLSEDHAAVGFRLLTVPERLRRAGSLGLLSFVEIGELVVDDRYPDEFGHDDQRWKREWIWYNGIQAELQVGKDIPIPDARVRHFAASR